MTVYEAIAEMRRLTAAGQSFSFAFMSYSYTKHSSEGFVQVARARLSKQSTKATNRFADYMLNYVDLDTLQTRRCWQPLLLELNGIPLELT